MPSRLIALCLLLVVAQAGQAAAQQNGVAVQLPTFSYFTVNTTVSVPDSGGAYVAAMKRQGFGRDEFGPLPRSGSSIGRGVQAGGLHISATIHDQQEMDEAVLGASEGTGAGEPSDEGLAGHLAAARKSTAGRATSSVSAIRQKQSLRKAAEAALALEYLERGRRAETGNQPGAAKVYYRMAAKRSTGELQQEALKRLTALSDPRGVAKAAAK